MKLIFVHNRSLETILEVDESVLPVVNESIMIEDEDYQVIEMGEKNYGKGQYGSSIIIYVVPN